MAAALLGGSARSPSDGRDQIPALKPSGAVSRRWEGGGDGSGGGSGGGAGGGERGLTMDYLGDKLTAAQGHMSQWVGSVRRSLHGALGLLGSAVGRERGAADLPTRAPLKRTSSFRHFASRSRESFRRFSLRSQQRFQSLRKRSTLSTGSDTTDIVSIALSHSLASFLSVSWNEEGMVDFGGLSG